MVDYEVFCYTVKYWFEGSCLSSEVSFHSEEDAIEFIKSFRYRWREYSLMKIQYAIIDF